MAIEFWIRADGTPIPQGSKTAGVTGTGRPYLRDVNPTKLKAWRENVAQAAWRAMQERDFKIDALQGPVEVMAWFYFEKPKSNTTYHPTSRQVGDLDKLCRALLDGLTDGGAWEDDSQVVQLSAIKLWAEKDMKPGVMVYCAALNEPGQRKPRRRKKPTNG